MNMPTGPVPAAANPLALMNQVVTSPAKVAEIPGKVAAGVKAAEPIPGSMPVKVQPPVVTTTKIVLAADALFAINKSGIRDLSKAGMATLEAIVARISAANSTCPQGGRPRGFSMLRGRSGNCCYDL
ncbi:MAG: hypothetical protein ACLPXB_14905 [Thiobacillaceae bacterium]